MNEKDLRSDMRFMSPTCILPFTQFFHEPQHNRICCVSRVAGETHNQIRDNILAGVWSKSCASCREVESRNEISYRQRQLAQISDSQSRETAIEHVEWYERTGEVRYNNYQISLSNICNYACVMCSPQVSSMIAKAKKVFPIVRNSPLPDDFIFEEKSYVAISGGEPFLNPVYLEMMKSIPKSCNVLVTTNGSIYDQRMLDELKKFDSYLLAVSVDGMGGVYEEIRKFGKWETVQNNVGRFVDELGQSHIGINTVVQKQNVAQLPELAHWIHGLGIGYWQLYTVLHKPELMVSDSDITFSKEDFPKDIGFVAQTYINSLLARKNNAQKT
jgi:wyosine [tRNA(Phe)-imidazoG37] synthetase (radical SAM superfamily)